MGQGFLLSFLILIVVQTVGTPFMASASTKMGYADDTASLRGMFTAIVTEY